MLEFETRGRSTNTESSVNVGNIFYGTEGYFVSGENWKAFRKRETVPFATSSPKARGKGVDVLPPKVAENLYHCTNFIDAIRSGNNETLHCDIIDGFYSSALPHLANISYRLGRELKFNGAIEKFINDPEADTMLTRNYRKPYVVPEEV